jgi:hypothetical protein
MRHTPAAITTAIINSVIMSQLAYRLQVTPITKTQAYHIDCTIKKVTKLKWNLPRTIDDNIIRDQRIGINFINIQQRLDHQLINNIMVHLSEKHIVSQVLDSNLQIFQRIVKSPQSLMACPIETSRTLTANFLIPYTSSRLLGNDITIRQNITHSDDIQQNLSSKDYNSHWKNLKKWGIAHIQDITSMEKPGHILPFSRITNRIRTSKKRRLCNMESEIPEWYAALIANFGNVDMDTVTVDTFCPLKQKSSLEHQIIKIPTYVTHVYVYGTPTHFGPACIVAWVSDRERLEVSTRYVKEMEDTTHATLWATLDVLLAKDTEQHIQGIYISCPHVVHLINMPREHMTVRDKLKVGYHTVLEQIQKHRGQTAIILCNGGINLANVSPRPQHAPHLILSNIEGIQIRHQQHEIHKYPGTHMKAHSKKHIEQEIDAKLANLWNQEDITEQSFRLLKYGRGSARNVSAINHLEQSFRIKAGFRKLSTLKEARKYSSKVIPDITCPRCKEEEEESYDHVWLCPDTQERKIEMIESTRIYMEERAETLIKDATNRDTHIVRIIEYMNEIYEQFTKTETAKGIITKGFRAQFQQYTQIQTEINDWIFLFIDSWLSAFYHIIWKKRNECIARRIESQKSSVQTSLETHEDSVAEDSRESNNTSSRNMRYQTGHQLHTQANTIRIRLTLQESDTQQEQADVATPFDPGGHNTTSHNSRQPIANSTDPYPDRIRSSRNIEYGNKWYIVRPDPIDQPFRFLIRDINRVHRQDYEPRREPALYQTQRDSHM